MNDMDLYQEEHRQAFIDMNKGLVDLGEKIDKLIESYVAPSSDVNVSGEVTVNTEKSVEVENLYELKESFTDLALRLETVIKDNSHKPLKNVTVENIKDIVIPEAVDIKNLDDLKKYFDKVATAISDNQPIVNVEKQDVVFPTNPSKPIAVRLSDGKSWINTLTQAVSAAMPETDPLVGYQPSDIDDATATKYYGFVKTNGSWYIMRESSGAYRYTRGDKKTDYETQWDGRTGLEYDYLYEVF